MCELYEENINNEPTTNREQHVLKKREKRERERESAHVERRMWRRYRETKEKEREIYMKGHIKIRH